MKARLNIVAVSPAAYRAMAGLERYISESSIEPRLVHLLKMRASQIKRLRVLPRHALQGCAGARGERSQRLYGLDAWREAPYYTDREWAALEWVESLTQITPGHVPTTCTSGRGSSSASENWWIFSMIALAINGWNRLAIAFRSEAGTYKPQQVARGS